MVPTTGTVSIWHLLTILLLLLIPFFLVAYAHGSLTRLGFALRFACWLVASAIGYGIAKSGHVFPFVPVFLLTILLFRWTAMRLNDAGWGRWWALLWYFWPVALVLAVTLCIKRPGGEDLALVFD